MLKQYAFSKLIVYYIQHLLYSTFKIRKEYVKNAYTYIKAIPFHSFHSQYYDSIIFDCVASKDCIVLQNWTL